MHCDLPEVGGGVGGGGGGGGGEDMIINQLIISKI